VQILAQNGITNAAALVGGTKAWKDKGYPMEAKEQKK
jgi:rhodanese-related sulfurtransferase